MIPTILHYRSRDELNGDLAEIVARELGEAIEARGKAVLAVPGGTTPGPFLRNLSQESLAWEKVTVMLTDERFVPETSDPEESNLDPVGSLVCRVPEDYP